jgi:DNA-binding CsgD family transcriptional regulator
LDQKTAVKTRDEIARLSRAGIDSWTFRTRVIQLLKRALPHDAVWFATADPTTLLFTGSFVEEIPERLTPAFVTNEFLENDVNKWVTLVRRRKPESLYRATVGRPDASSRYREILAPLGLGDELRVALTDGPACWGFICLHREIHPAGFSEEEIAFLQSITRHLARGLRAGLLIENLAIAPETNAPGLLILSEDLSLVSTTQSALLWLDEIRDFPQRKELPQSVYALARRLRELENAERGEKALSPRVRVRTLSGRWLLMHAMRLSGTEADRRIGVILEPAPSADVVPVVLQAYGLTNREAEIAQLVLRGSSTVEIADCLCISGLTVQQHLKAIFEKTGVSSRRELSARILYEQCVPHMISGATPSTRGGFLDSRPVPGAP